MKVPHNAAESQDLFAQYARKRKMRVIIFATKPQRTKNFAATSHYLREVTSHFQQNWEKQKVTKSFQRRSKEILPLIRVYLQSRYREYQLRR